MVKYLTNTEPQEFEVEILTDGGPWAPHNMHCAVCYDNSAVLDLHTGLFQPCWACQSQGWNLQKKRRRFGKR